MLLAAIPTSKQFSLLLREAPQAFVPNLSPILLANQLAKEFLKWPINLVGLVENYRFILDQTF